LAFLVLIGINVNILLGVPTSYVIMMSGLVAFGLLYVSMQVLAYLSMVSIVAICSAVMALVWSGIALPSGGPEFESYHSELRFEGLACSLGLALFCFSGHPCLPSVYWNMKDPAEFKVACWAGFGIAGVFYAIVCSVGYYFFGDFIDQSFTENLGKSLDAEPIPGLNFLPIIAAAGFVIKLQGTMPLIFGPVITVLESTLGIDHEMGDLKKIAFRLIVIIASILTALLFKDTLIAVCDVSGCMMTMATSVIFPCAMFSRIVPETGAAMRALLFSVAASGVIFAIYGTADAMQKVLKGS